MNLRLVQDGDICGEKHTAPSGRVFVCVSRLHSVNAVGHYFVPEDGDHPCLGTRRT